MKRVLYFAFVYLASMLTGTLAFAMLFMFSCNLSMFVTGLEASFFSLHFFMTGILISLPLVCVLVQVLLIFFLVRHPKKKLTSFFLYLFFGLLSWLVFIPTDLKLISRYESDSIVSRVQSTSSGIFRKEDNGVYYFSRINEDNTADGVFIDTDGYFGTEGAVIPFFDSPVSNESAFPYSDILIKNSLQPPYIVTFPLSIYNALLTAAGYSISLGFLAWLAFASFGLALLSVYGLQFASSWKLANVACILTAVLLIVLVNYFYYMNILPEVLREISAKLAQFSGIKDSLIILVNLIVSALLIVFGVLMGLYRYGTSNLESDE